jgi:lipopolysaccharide/colanic/teichoic acid biosynthesis glycosyltransferase
MTTEQSQVQPAIHTQSDVHRDHQYVTITSPVPLAQEPILKRPLDLALAGMMILVSLPVFLVIALAIKLEDGGPVFFRQERWGRGGNRFFALKFRTMIPDADKIHGVRQATKNDKRITRVGHLLRAMGLDELPQIYNIWRGDMSFVGPRALAVGELIKNGAGEYVPYDHVPGFYERLAVRPGLTSIATIYIAKDSPPRRKFRYDLFYIRNLSFWLDVRLIALSYWISFRGKWESREKKV